ncbi:MAG TPA: MlaA family lipoprotein [Crenalkalicoccus sp.]|nr:MlaA family lipoprotein [Crenalkalicoccus sp.]
MRFRSAVALALCLALPGAGRAAAAPDPLEPVNRRVHAFNELVRARVLHPLAALYRAQVPAELRQEVANAAANLREPITAASGLAAGELGIAANAVARFGINSTLGWGGLHDRAAELGFPRRPFGVADAVCAWGAPSGPFLVLPLLGPSTLRDAAATAAAGVALSQAIGPDAYLAWSGGDALVGYVEADPELARIAAESLDGYAVLRSAYLQRRAEACAVDREAEP